MSFRVGAHINGLVLVVDDSRHSRQLLANILGGEGYTVLLADCGDTALATARADQPSLAILDMMMPGMGGLEVLQQLQGDPLTQAIPVILATSSTDIAHRVKALELGAADFITKPFDSTELLVRASAQIRLARLHALAGQQADELSHFSERLETESAGRKQSERRVAAAELGDANLANAAMALLGCRGAEDVYDAICDFMLRLVPDAVVIVNETAPDLETLTTRRVEGLEKSRLARASRLVGFEIVGKSQSIASTHRHEMLSGTLSAVPGGFEGLASFTIPRVLARAVAKTFRLHDAYSIGIADMESALGNIQIYTRAPGVVLPAHLIESFAHQCYSTLDRLEKAQALAESADLNNLMLSNMVEGLALHEIILDESGEPCDYRYIEVSPSFEAMTGLEAESIIGRTVLEVLPGIETLWVERFGAVATTGVAAHFVDYPGQLNRFYEVTAYSPRSGQFATVISDVTERSIAQASLIESEQRFEALFERAPLGYQSLDASGCFIEVNIAWLETLGYQREEVIGHWFGDFLAPEYVEAFADRFPLFKERGTVHSEFDMIHKDGHRRTIAFEGRIGHNPDGTFKQSHCILSDITERKLAEEAMRASEEKHQAILQTAIDGFWLVDAQGFLLEVNTAYCEMSGYAEHELLSMHISNLEAAGSVEAVLVRMQDLAENGQGRFESKHRRKDGSSFDIGASVQFRPSEGGSYAVFIRDITERKRLDEALQHRIVALTQPVEESGGLTFSDLFDIEDIQSIQDAFAASAGVASIITTPDGSPITQPSNYSRLCADVVKRTEKGRANCLASDASIGCESPSSLVIRHCLGAGLLDAGTSIHAGGEHIATWLIAQVRDETQTDDELLAYADEIGVDREDFGDALAEIPVMPREQFERIAHTLFTFARKLSVIAYQNVQQARMISDRERAERELVEEQRRGTEQLERSLSSIVRIVGRVAEARDPYTAGHQRRVSELAVRIAREIGMSAEKTEEVRIASLLHDIGKLSVPTEILSKPGRLTAIEFELIKTHCEAGYEIISSAEMEGATAEIVLQHHERCDGSGYPRGLKADQLLEASKVIAVADVVEAMSSHRPYRAALGVERALEEIAMGAGKLYDTRAVNACVRLFREQEFEFSRS